MTIQANLGFGTGGVSILPFGNWWAISFDVIRLRTEAARKTELLGIQYHSSSHRHSLDTAAPRRLVMAIEETRRLDLVSRNARFHDLGLDDCCSLSSALL